MKQRQVQHRISLLVCSQPLKVVTKEGQSAKEAGQCLHRLFGESLSMALLGPVATFSPTSVLEILLLLLQEPKSACYERLL